MKKTLFLVTTLLAVAFFTATPAADAQSDYPRDLGLSWTNADQYTDGSAIQEGDLETVRVECFRNGALTAVVSAQFPANGEGTAQTETLIGAIPSPGNYECFGFSVIFDGTASDASAPASKRYTGKPLPPQPFIIVIVVE